MVSFVLFIASFAFILLMGAVAWVWLVGRELLNVSGLLSSTLVQTIQNSFSWGIGFAAVVFIFSTALAAGYAIFFSRRIAGPVYAFLKHLDRCETSGKFEKFKLRQNDLFQELPEKFNRIVELQNKRG